MRRQAQNFNNLQNSADNKAADDWQALRDNLINLLEQVESQVAFSSQTMAGENSKYKHTPNSENLHTTLRGQIFSQTQPTNNATYQNLSSLPNEEQAQRINRNEGNFDDFSQTLDKITKRLENFERQFSANQSPNAEFARINTQIEQLTKTIEQLSNNVGNNLNFKDFDAKIEYISKLLSQPPKSDNAKLSKQLDNLVQNIEQLSHLQSQAIEQIGSLRAENIEQLTNLQKQNVEHLSKLHSEILEQINNIYDSNSGKYSKLGEVEKSDFSDLMASIKETVANIYDKIDGLEQNLAINPQHIERLFQEMGAISAETAKISQRLKNGEADKDIPYILSRIDVLSKVVAEMGQYDDGVKELQFELKNLQQNLQQALDPNFSLLNEQVKELALQGQQTNEQLDYVVKLLQKNDKTSPVNSEKLADIIANQIARTISLQQENLQNNVVGPNTLKEITSHLSQLTDIIDKQLGEESLKNIHNVIEQVDRRLLKLEEKIGFDSKENASHKLSEQEKTLNNTNESLPASSLIDAKAEDVEEALESIRRRFLQEENEFNEQKSGAKEQAKPTGSKEEENSKNATMENEETTVQSERVSHNVDQAQYINLLDEEDEIDNEVAQEGFGHELEREFEKIINDDENGLVYQGRQECSDKEAITPQIDNGDCQKKISKENNRPEQKNVKEQSALRKETESQENIAEPQVNLADERPAKPKSIFEEYDAEENIRRKEEERSDISSIIRENVDNITGSEIQSEKDKTSNISRNTFIEAARRASMRQNALLREEEETQSLLARGLSRIKSANFSSALSRAKKKNDNQQNNNKQNSEQISNKKETPLTKLTPLFKKTNSKKETPKEAKQISPFARYYRPAILSIALIGAIVLMLNLFVGRTHTGDSSLSAQSEKTPLANFETPENEQQPFEITQENEVTPNEEQPHPLIDETSTGSISKQVNNKKEQVRIIQTMPVSLDEKPKEIIVNQNSEERLVKIDSLTTNSIGQDQDIVKIDMLDLEQKTDSQQKANPLKKGNIGENTATLPIKFELPDEKIGPIELREAAANGDVRAQFEVGAIYGEGKLLEQDFEKAAIWFERAAANGFAPAALRLGGLYESGKGVEQNFEQAKLWYQRAAEAGNRMAMHNLASLYAGGELGEQRFLEAIEWFERAARLGLTDSQFNLGMLHARGLGVEQDLGEAYFWFAIAAKSGDKDAIKARDDVARSLNSDIIMEQKQRVANWQMDKVDIVANFAPIGTWAKDFNPGPKIENSDIIEKVQIALKKLGYDVGTPDGIMGPRTSEAIKEFESDTGMSLSGKVNPRLLAVLGSQPV